jgi:hypothetical protein
MDISRRLCPANLGVQPERSAMRIDELLPWNWQPQSVAHAA